MFRSATIVSSFEVEMNEDSWIQTIRLLAIPPAFGATRLESAVGSLGEVFVIASDEEWCFILICLISKILTRKAGRC